MEQLIPLDWVSVLSIILSVASIVLAIASIAISIIFYRWSKNENERASNLSVSISEKVSCLEKLFDKMISIGRARFFDDGETVLLIEREQELMGSSADSEQGL